MSSVSGNTSDAARFAGLSLLRWQSWPMRQRPLHAVLLVASLLAGAAGVHWTTGRVYLAIASVLLLAATLWRFFLPVTFELSDAGIDYWVLGRRRRIAWEWVRGCRLGPDGALLLPREDATSISWLNGIFVPWDGQKEQFLGLLQRYIPPAALHHDQANRQSSPQQANRQSGPQQANRQSSQ